ncbi:hypothetical protein V8E55_008787 [Tylopilus felleus]
MRPSPITPTVLHTTYIAVSLQDILYGVELVLYFETMHAVLTLRRKRRADILHMLFSIVMLVLITISVSTNVIFGEDVCISHSDYPGGDSAYWSSTSSTIWYKSLGRAANFVLQLMTDALLIHRCRAIWNNTLAIIVPLLLWLASLVLGGVQMWMFDFVVVTFLPESATLISLAYYSICVLLNTILTSLICYPIIRYGKLIRTELGHEHSAVYFAVAEIIVESALPFTLSGIAFLVALGVRSYAVTPLSWVYFMMTCISPHMLILRVQKRRKLRQETDAFTSSGLNITFRHLPEGPAQQGDGPEGTLNLRPLSRVRSASAGDIGSKIAAGTDISP